MSARRAELPEGAILPNVTLDSTLLRVHYGFEVLDLWEAVERVA
jgi:hypothetical protein